MNTKVSIFCDFCTLQKSGMLQTTTFKRNLVPRFGKARKKDRFGKLGLHQLGGLPPLKEKFCGQSKTLFQNVVGLLSSCLRVVLLKMTLPELLLAVEFADQQKSDRKSVV